MVIQFGLFLSKDRNQCQVCVWTLNIPDRAVWVRACRVLLCCVLGQDTVLCSQCLSSPRCVNTIGYGKFEAEGITLQVRFLAVLCSFPLKAMLFSSLPLSLLPTILFYPQLLRFFPQRHFIRCHTLSLFRPSLKGKRSSTGVLWKKHLVSI